MEAWKFLDYRSVSPAYALSLTAERWGLDAFPGNLVASPNYLEQVVQSNSSTFEIEFWKLPYDCSSSLREYQAALNSQEHLYRREEEIVSSFCSEPCAVSGCLILIEGIGKTRTGPAHSSIVGLTHGISFILALFLSIAIIMGFLPWTKKDKSTPMPPRLNGYNPPPIARKRLNPENTQQQARSAKEIVDCADLLREMYSMDLKIWGLQHAVDPKKREDYKYRANALFIEICRIVQGWRESEGRWSREEWEQIEEMSAFLDQHGRMRYEV